MDANKEGKELLVSCSSNENEGTIKRFLLARQVVMWFRVFYFIQRGVRLLH
jgi:hypothetical protein